MKSSLAILFLFICLACSAQTDSAFYRKVDVEPVLINKNSQFGKSLYECRDEVNPDSLPYVDCIVEVTVGSDGKVLEANLINKVSECVKKACLDTIKPWVFKPAVLKDKKVTSIIKANVRMYTKPM